jgi:hypothetical protein
MKRALVLALLCASSAARAGDWTAATATATSSLDADRDGSHVLRHWCAASGKDKGESVTVHFETPVELDRIELAQPPLVARDVKANHVVLVTVRVDGGAKQQVRMKKDGTAKVAVTGTVSSVELRIDMVRPVKGSASCLGISALHGPKGWVDVGMFSDLAASHAVDDDVAAIGAALRRCREQDLGGKITFPITVDDEQNGPTTYATAADAHKDKCRALQPFGACEPSALDELRCAVKKGDDLSASTLEWHDGHWRLTAAQHQFAGDTGD